MRGVNPGDINRIIGQYNSTQSGALTPAGQALVSAGLFTQAQLAALGAVTDTLSLAPAGQVGNDWFKALDMKVTFPIRLRERFTVEPSFAFFNILNFANFSGSPSAALGFNSTTNLNGALTGTAGSANGTTYNDQANRSGLGSGVFQSGAPRQVEFGLRVSF
jgi:hypothetical protein